MVFTTKGNRLTVEIFENLEINALTLNHSNMYVMLKVHKNLVVQLLLMKHAMSQEICSRNLL